MRPRRLLLGCMLAASAIAVSSQVGGCFLVADLSAVVGRDGNENVEANGGVGPGKWPDSPTVWCGDGVTEIACPASGQVAYGQDGNVRIDVPTYSGDVFTVTDSVTQLVWQKDETAPATWQAAQDACSTLSFAGQTDWRLPSRRELVSLLDYGRHQPAMDSDAFNPSQDSLWTSTPYAGSAGEMWDVAMDYGVMGGNQASALVAFRCVRGPVYSGPEYSVSDETVHDSTTGLTWQRQASADETGWLGALEYCAEVALANLSGYSDWRLPSAKELPTIVDDQKLDPAIDLDAFPGTNSESFWTSSPDSMNLGQAFGVDFTSGVVIGANAVPNGFRVRCVRGP